MLRLILLHARENHLRDRSGGRNSNHHAVGVTSSVTLVSIPIPNFEYPATDKLLWIHFDNHTSLR
jgi:hypothetical protein